MGINKKNIAIANLKMYLSSKSDADRWLETFIKSTKGVNLKNTLLVICPPIAFLDSFSHKIKTDWIELGAQNCFWENQGSFTGEFGPRMISSLNGKFVILGHSERRMHLKETNQEISKKISFALKNSLFPIVCIGESAEEKEHDQTMEVILNQLDGCLSEVTQGKIEDVIICYEPIWAISSNGPNRIPTINEIMGARILIKKFLSEKYGPKLAEKVKIIYGGSIDDKNVKEVCIDPTTNGALIGKASTLPHTLLKICKILDGEEA